LIAAGRPDDLVADAGVRVVVTDLADAPAIAGRFGSTTADDDGLRILCPPDAIPALVGALVAAGGRVHAVVPLRSTLEDRFLELVSASGR
jgi:hypothetical protein